MKSIASAPAKIILFGEHFVVHGTKAILAAIDKRVTVTSTFTENKTIKVNSELGTIEVLISSSHEEVESNFRPFVYLANKIIQGNQNVNGLEITIDSDIPIGVGLGSSSACCVAAAASISELFKKLSSEEILNLSIEAEKTIFPNTSGADCTVCTYGGMIIYDKIGGIEKIDNTSDLNFIITNTMIPHSTKRSVEKVNKFKEDYDEEWDEMFVDMEGIIDTAIQAIRNNDVDTLGKEMYANHQKLAGIGVSNDTLDDVICRLNKISLGSKITGAGDGGCIIALVRDENVDKVPALLPKDKECFSAKIDTKGVVWSTIEE